VPTQRELARPTPKRERGDRCTLQVHAAGSRTSPREQRSRDGGNTPWDKALHTEQRLEVQGNQGRGGKADGERGETSGDAGQAPGWSAILWSARCVQGAKLRRAGSRDGDGSGVLLETSRTPRLELRCNTRRGSRRSKPSRWWKTTKAEHETRLATGLRSGHGLVLAGVGSSAPKTVKGRSLETRTRRRETTSRHALRATARQA